MGEEKKDKNLWIYLSALAGALAITIIYFFMNGISSKDSNASQAFVGKTEAFTGAILITSMGNIEIEFLSKEAPKTVENFIKLAEKDFYNDTKFHRIIKDFMVQGGDPNTKGNDISTYGRGGPGYSFDDEKNEIGLVKGIVAMANSGPNTNGSQFFIITAPETPWLQGKHTPFARVKTGMNVLEVLNNVQTKKCTQIEYMTTVGCDMPLKPVVLKSIMLK